MKLTLFAAAMAAFCSLQSPVEAISMQGLAATSVEAGPAIKKLTPVEMKAYLKKGGLTIGSTMPEKKVDYDNFNAVNCTDIKRQGNEWSKVFKDGASDDNQKKITKNLQEKINEGSLANAKTI